MCREKYMYGSDSPTESIYRIPVHCYFEVSFLIFILYFHCLKSGQLNEYTERKDMSADVICMALASVPSGEQRSRFLAVGLADNTVRIISLDPTVIIIHSIFVS